MTPAPPTAAYPAPSPASTRTGPSLRACLALIATICVLMAAVEVGTRLVVTRISRIEARVAREHAAAIAPVSAARPQMLFVGNSLLDAALQFDSFATTLAPRADARRFVVEQTSFHDWHYGLRRLFAEGSRPNTVVLMLSGDQLVSKGSRGEYSAYQLVSHADILRFCGDLDLHPTNAANMVFANFSMFYALRSEIRKVLLGKLMPEVPAFIGKLAVSPAPKVPATNLLATATARLSALKAECDKHGVRLVYAIPPLPEFREAPILRDATAAAGVPAFLPYSASDFSREDFSDGFHLNEAGAAKYTALASAELLRSTEPAAH